MRPAIYHETKLNDRRRRRKCEGRFPTRTLISRSSIRPKAGGSDSGYSNEIDKDLA